jgi:hypothetical protein
MTVSVTPADTRLQTHIGRSVLWFLERGRSYAVRSGDMGRSFPTLQKAVGDRAVRSTGRNFPRPLPKPYVRIDQDWAEPDRALWLNVLQSVLKEAKNHSHIETETTDLARHEILLSKREHFWRR